LAGLLRLVLRARLTVSDCTQPARGDRGQPLHPICFDPSTEAGVQQRPHGSSRRRVFRNAPTPSRSTRARSRFSHRSTWRSPRPTRRARPRARRRTDRRTVAEAEWRCRGCAARARLAVPIITDQKTKPGTTNQHPVRSAKPPSPVQIRAAPPKSLGNSRVWLCAAASCDFLLLRTALEFAPHSEERPL
jgi:hypothetical protein